MPAFILHIFAIAGFINPSAHLEYHGSEHRATIPTPSNHKTALHLSSSVVADVKLGSLVKDVFLANSFFLQALVCFFIVVSGLQIGADLELNVSVYIP